MIIDDFNLGHTISRENIQEMITWEPRRWKLSHSWPKALHEPEEPDKDWSIVLPFWETFERALTMCHVNHIGLKTIKERPQLKDEPIEKKLESIEGTVSIDPRALENQVVLLVDDLYQSGVSTNYVAMLMLEAGAKEIFGLACEKTCRNDDNVERSLIK